MHRLQQAGHLVSVVLPHQQRSWIGKAHLVGQLTKPSYFRPGTVHQDDGTVHEFPSAASDTPEEWVLVNGTPAACAQLGLFHFYQDRPPVDLVVSGPNYGRNSTTVFSLSSGTLGGALEAAVCQKKAIALSFAFTSRKNEPAWVADACEHAVKLIEHLTKVWHEGVDLYSVNVPVLEERIDRTILITNSLHNYWTSGSSFDEVDAETETPDPEVQEQEIRSSVPQPALSQDEAGAERTVHKHRWFKWAPKFADIQKSVEQSEPGNDGWAVRQGYTRCVCPLSDSLTREIE